MIHLRFLASTKGYPMDAKHAWFFSAPHAGDNSKTNYKKPERETATGYLSKGRVFDVPMRHLYFGVLACASGKPDKDAEGADALSFS